MQVPHVPPQVKERSGPPAAIRLAVAATVAAGLGGYTLALGLTGIPVVVAAVAGLIAGLVLIGALAE